MDVKNIWIAQLNPLVGDVRGNLKRILESIQQAKLGGAQLIVFAELCVSGYPPKDLLESAEFIDACLEANTEIAKQSDANAMIIWGNVIENPERAGKPLYNVANCAVNGEIIGQAIKTHLPTYDVFCEARYFEAGQANQAIFKTTHPNGAKIAISVCEDIWSHPALSEDEKRLITPIQYKEKLFTQALDCDVLVNCSASPYVSGKPTLRLKLLDKIARAENATVVYANQVGAQDDILFDGHSSISSPDSKQCIWLGFESTTRSGGSSEPHPETKHLMREIREAIVMGIRDYFKKTGFQRALIGLSGGVDSALVAALACQALGRENVEAVMMPGPYSSPHSLTDSIDLADNLGIATRQISIGPMFDSGINLLNAGGQRLEDLAEQNLQARLRGIILMTLSNRESKLVLATSNKSELAMGYSTLYGDSCGALAPIGDLYKTQAYELCKYLNTQYGQHSAYIPEHILSKAPSAELAPNQKDEDSLGPYSELDPILKNIIEGDSEITENSSTEHIRRRVFQNEYKRQQGPIILKLSPKAFGSGRQYLITQSLQAVASAVTLLTS